MTNDEAPMTNESQLSQTSAAECDSLVIEN